jgi:hypothetical protein
MCSSCAIPADSVSKACAISQAQLVYYWQKPSQLAGIRLLSLKKWIKEAPCRSLGSNGWGRIDWIFSNRVETIVPLRWHPAASRGPAVILYHNFLLLYQTSAWLGPEFCAITQPLKQRWQRQSSSPALPADSGKFGPKPF